MKLPLRPDGTLGGWSLFSSHAPFSPSCGPKAVGASVGLSRGSAIASFLVPGVGAFFAIGLGAAALLGLGGAAAGASLGEASEAADIGVPKDDTFLYRDLLKRGRSLLIANIDDSALVSRPSDS